MLRALSAFMFAGVFVLAGCGLKKFKQQEDKLRPLVQRRATSQEVIALLGFEFLYSSKGQTNWASLAQFLSREPTNRLMAVRERVVRWPNVMFYSTPEMMTWVFLDEDSKVVDFVVGAQ